MMQRFRLWLANLISGGELDLLKDHVCFWQGLRTEALIEKFKAQDANARALELIERMEGVISGLQNDVVVKQGAADMWEARWVETDNAWVDRVALLCRAIGRHEATIAEIIACDTPGGNGTVKRMVRIAREGLTPPLKITYTGKDGTGWASGVVNPNANSSVVTSMIDGEL